MNAETPKATNPTIAAGMLNHATQAGFRASLAQHPRAVPAYWHSMAAAWLKGFDLAVKAMAEKRTNP